MEFKIKCYFYMIGCIEVDSLLKFNVIELVCCVKMNSIK